MDSRLSNPMDALIKTSSQTTPQAPKRFGALGQVALLLTWVLSLNGCDRPDPFRATDVTGAAIGGDFRLRDHNQQLRTLADYRGRVVLLAFGFTHCPDVCPTLLGKLANVLRQLDKDADRVQVLFVTADPKRDTPTVLKQYATAFHSRFVGLTATPTDFNAFKQRYRLFAERRISAENYVVDHSASVYVLDDRGRVRLHVPADFSVEDWLHDLRLLL